MIRCKDNESLEKLQAAVSNRFKEKYNVHNPKVLNPKIKIVDIRDNIAPQDLIDIIRKQNDNLIKDDSQIKLLQLINIDDARNMRYTAYVEVDGATFKRLIDAKKVYIGWSRCRVFEELKLTRCFNCSGFNHRANTCQEPAACTKCAGNHQIGNCNSETLKCINCMRAANKFNIIELDINHAAWDRGCPTYIKKLEIKQSQVK